MVLPARIELATSALPRMRSTTELRQQRHSGERGLCPRPVRLVTRTQPGHIRPMATTKDDDRAARLAAALRANLQKRKAQARGAVADRPEPDAKAD